MKSPGKASIGRSSKNGQSARSLERPWDLTVAQRAALIRPHALRGCSRAARRDRAAGEEREYEEDEADEGGGQDVYVENDLRDGTVVERASGPFGS